jgi:cob(I)alamin adenosyltransferase
MSKIYTKTGDKGMTSLTGGERVEKYHPRIEAYGSIDELNSFIGLLIAEVEVIGDTFIALKLRTIQTKLFAVGAYLSTKPKSSGQLSACGITDDDVAELEHDIDCIAKELPALKSFVLPYGTRTVALAHVCRTVCRRAERKMLRAFTLDSSFENASNNSPNIYVNRLSDLLFVIARRLCILQRGSEFFLDNT